MFKKRIRVAGVMFGLILMLTFVCLVGWLISVKISKGTEELKVLTGDPDIVEGVNISLGVAERIWDRGEYYFERETAVRHADHFYKTRTAQITKGQVETGLSYKRDKKTGLKNRMLFCGLSPEFPQKEVKGTHFVSGKDFSYDLKWYLTDGYTYYGEERYLFPAYVTFGEEATFYFEGLEPEDYEENLEGRNLLFWDDTGQYSGRFLCELNGALYGYPTAEPEDDFGTSEVSMTVNRGIYRFEENGTVTCVFPMNERGDEFSFLWLMGEEEKNALTVIGAKGNALLAYTYAVDTETVEEKVLWNGGEEFSSWVESAERCIMADFVTDGERMYLCYTDMDYNKVRLVVFEDGQRLFEGELLEREHTPERLQDFSMNLNETTENLSVLDKLEISFID